MLFCTEIFSNNHVHLIIMFIDAECHFSICLVFYFMNTNISDYIKCFLYLYLHLDAK